MIRINKKKRNPHIPNNMRDILRSADNIKYLKSGVEAEVYKFTINKNIVLNSQPLKAGTYAIKIYYQNRNLNLKQIDQLITFSKYGLIPKIYIITAHYIIMKYIEGITFEEFSYSSELRRILTAEGYQNVRKTIKEKIENLLTVWEKLGFKHGDIFNSKNILISKDFNHVYFIDPWV